MSGSSGQNQSGKRLMKKLIIICIILFAYIQSMQSKACEPVPVPTPTPIPTETPLLSLQLRGD